MTYLKVGGFDDNGWMPRFVVIGFDNVVYYNEVVLEMVGVLQAVRDAIDSFDSSSASEVTVVAPITDKTLVPSEVLNIDVSNVFLDSGGDSITITVQSNSNPSKATANLVGNMLTITASNTEYVGSTSIVIKGENVADNQSAQDEFIVNIVGNEWNGASITPLNVDIIVLPDQTDTDIVNILSGIPAVLNFSGSINFESKKSNSVEKATAPKAQWDQQFAYDITALSGGVGDQTGCETDGNFIYTTVWSSADILKFEMDGTYIETFQIPGVTGLRDLAYDGQYFYGGAAGTAIWKMDFAGKQLMSSITSPTEVRAIAYDDARDGFWVNNWDSDMVLVGRDGSTIDTIGSIPSCYGVAYDHFSPGGPYLWLNTGTYAGTLATVVQFDIATGITTGVSFQVGVTETAGGCFIQEGIVSGTATIGVLAQNEKLYGYELCSIEAWLTLSNASGAIPANGNHDVTLNFDSTGLTLGDVKTATLVFRDENNFEYTSPVNITMTVSGAGTPETPINVVTSILGSDINVTWDASAGATSYDVYGSDDPYGEFALLGNIATNYFTVPVNQAKYFYYVVAKN